MGSMLNGQPRRTVRSRRSSSIIAQAIAVLAKYGGSWWQSGPEYSFTGSDGTGAAGDGSDVGYGVDRCATLGPERIADVELSTGNNPVEWTTSGTNASNTVAFSPGFVTFNTSDTTNISMNKANALVIGAAYEAEIVVTDQSGGIVPGIFTGSADITFGSGVGTKRVVFVANNTTLVIKRIGGGVGSFTIDRVSVKEIIGRPLTQATTGFKPKLKRVPKRLGPELVTNGNFAVSSGWLGAGGAVAISGNTLTLTSSGAGYAARAESINPLALNVGSTYVLAVNTPSGGSFRLGSTQGQPQLYSSPTLSTGYTAVNWVATAAQAYISLTGSSTSGVQNTFTQASVREVLEWGWAWVFDGVDDSLATVSQSSAPSETLFAAKYLDTFPAVAAAAVLRAPVAANTGALLYAGSTSQTMMRIGNGASFSYLATSTPLGGGVVQSGIFGTQSKHRINGTQVATTAAGYSPATGPIIVGGNPGLYGTQKIFAAAYAPAALTDAEMLIVEKAMAQLGGITI